MTIYRAASFFSGIGAMDYAAFAAFAGLLEIAHLCEIDSYKRGILRKHALKFWPTAVIHEDVRNVSGDHLGGLDLIYGGFPCTDISSAGRGKGLSGSQSGLWFELARIISQSRPRTVVLENVPAIKARGGTTVTAQLASLGYDGVWITVPAYHFGSPQNRFRWFYVAVAGGKRYTQAEARPVCGQVIGHGCERQPRQITDETQSASKGRRAAAAAKGRRSRWGTQSPMGRMSDGTTAGLDITSHRFPSGAWLPQQPHEPPRLASPTPTWKNEIAALGDIVLPQQCYPVFQAVYQFLEQQKARQ